MSWATFWWLQRFPGYHPCIQEIYMLLIFLGFSLVNPSFIAQGLSQEPRRVKGDLLFLLYVLLYSKVLPKCFLYPPFNASFTLSAAPTEIALSKVTSDHHKCKSISYFLNTWPFSPSWVAIPSSLTHHLHLMLGKLFLSSFQAYLLTLCLLRCFVLCSPDFKMTEYAFHHPLRHHTRVADLIHAHGFPSNHWWLINFHLKPGPLSWTPDSSRNTNLIPLPLCLWGISDGAGPSPTPCSSLSWLLLHLSPYL